MRRRVCCGGVLLCVVSALLAGCNDGRRTADEDKVSARPSAGQILASISGLTTHGWIDGSKPSVELERRLAQGRRISVACGTVVELGRRALQRYGYQSRVVQTLTLDRENGLDDGHIMLSVWTGRWVLYDLDNDRVAVDQSGQPTNTVEQLAAGHARMWRVIAHDGRRIDVRGTSQEIRRYVRDVVSKRTLSSWYDRVLGVAMIPLSNGRTIFHAPSDQRWRIWRKWPSATWVSANDFRRLATAPPSSARS